MNTKEIVELILESSNNSPYQGKLSKSNNISAGIDLAKLCKSFAENGQYDEAMGFDTEQWILVISELESLKLNN